MSRTSILSLFLLNTLVSGTRISQKKCAEYNKMFPTIHNEAGEEAAPKEFPFMAKFQDSEGFYSGILISENFVLSVASIYIPGTIIVLGDLDLIAECDDSQPKTYNITNRIVHPHFHEDYAFADIGLYQLNESVKFTEYVRPACLSLKNLSVSEDLIQDGWGRTNIRLTNSLHKATLNYMSNKRCKTAYEMAGRQKYVRDIEKKKIFCAESEMGSREIMTGRGSAVIHDDPSAKNDVIGLLISTLKREKANVKVAVRVAAYIDWIERIVWPEHSERIVLPDSDNALAGESERKTKTFAIYLIIGTISLALMVCATTVVCILLNRSGARSPVTVQMRNNNDNIVQIESFLQ